MGKRSSGLTRISELFSAKLRWQTKGPTPIQKRLTASVDIHMENQSLASVTRPFGNALRFPIGKAQQIEARSGYEK